MRYVVMFVVLCAVCLTQLEAKGKGKKGKLNEIIQSINRLQEELEELKERVGNLENLQERVENLQERVESFENLVERLDKLEEEASAGPPVKGAILATRQSNTAHSGEARLAVDGNSNRNYFGRSCTHTPQEQSPWWEAEFSSPVRITSVQLINRQDCCWDRLRNVVVTVDGKVCGNIAGGGNENYLVSCNEPLVGKTVRVAINGPGILTLCEVNFF